MQEKWRDIPGYEGSYQASNLGRIRSLDRVITRAASSRRGAYKAKLKGRFIKPVKNTQGYMVVPLGRSNSCARVHQLIAKTFIPNRDGKPMINHKNGDKSDNRVTNLEWCTNQENQIHAVKVLKRPQGAYQNKPIRCVETGEVFENSIRAANGNKQVANRIRMVANGYYGRKTCNGYHWEFV